MYPTIACNILGISRYVFGAVGANFQDSYLNRILR